MITNQDRSKWFGASDSNFICGNWETPSFRKWWLVKLGLKENNFSNKAMKTGNAYEHKIADALGIKGTKDTQKKNYLLRLRVNYDFVAKEAIYEIKTYNYDKKFKISKNYWQQAQVEMFMKKKKLFIVSYGLLEEDYLNYFKEVDIKRLDIQEVEYDEKFIKEEYLPKLRYLAYCLRKGILPDANRF